MKSLFCLALYFGASHPLFAAVPPEVPEQRTYQIFNPMFFDWKDMGETTLMSDLGGLNYETPDYYKNATLPDDNPDIATISNPPIIGFQRFLTMATTGAGLLAWSSHGTENAVMVDIYCPGDLDSICWQQANSRGKWGQVLYFDILEGDMMMSRQG